MRIRHLLAAAATFAAVPASAAITFTGSFAVAGDAIDLSGDAPAQGGNLLNFGSDLVFDRGSNLFYGLTDRGPGGGVLAGYAPRINVFRLKTDATTNAIQGFKLEQTIVFTRPDGSRFDGGNPRLLTGDASNLGASFDPEGLVRLKNGNFLVSDEYGPSVYEFDASGKQIRSFTVPANLVPRQADSTANYVDGRAPMAPGVPIVTGRQDNRGYEGLTISKDGTKVYAVLQDPLVNEGAQNDGRRSRNVRIVEYDYASGTQTAQYIYQLESRDDINARVPTQTFGATAQGRNIGVSAITANDDGSFFVIERDNRGLGVDDPTGTNLIGSKRVYRIRLEGATDVKDISLAGTDSLGTSVAVSKTLFLDVQDAVKSAAGVDVFEKVEGIAFGRDLTGGGLSLFLVTDNDYSVTQTGAGEQFSVCTSGDGGVSSQVALGAACTPGQSLIPTQIYGFSVTGADAAGLAVPEPATWALMIGGFGLVGGAARRRRSVVA